MYVCLFGIAQSIIILEKEKREKKRVFFPLNKLSLSHDYTLISHAEQCELNDTMAQGMQFELHAKLITSNIKTKPSYFLLN